MARESLYPARRRGVVIELLRERGQASIRELATRFEVSEDTVRRDVEALATQGLVERTRGGVTISADDRYNLAPADFAKRVAVQAAAKNAIARAAAALVTDGQSLIINGGTTALAVAKHLASKRGVAVVTNNLLLPQELSMRGIREVYLLGGSYRLRSQVTVGPVAISDGSGMPRSIHADWAIIGVGAVSEDGTVWTASLPEASTMRSMMDSAGQTILLADNTKFGKREFAEVTALSATTTLITDRRPSRALLERAAEVGARVIVTEESDAAAAANLEDGSEDER